MKCQSCGREVQPEWNVCPHCGERIERPTPEQARQALGVLQAMKARRRLPVSRDPAQLAAAMKYVDAVTLLVAQFSGVFKGFLDHHGKMKRKPSLLNDAKWVATAKVLLVAVYASAIGATDPEKPILKELDPVPDGCFLVHCEVFKIQQFAEELASRYDAFIERRVQADLDAAGEAVQELSSRLTKALDAIDKLVREIRATAS